MRRNKVMTAAEAANFINDCDTVAVGGALGGECAEALLLALKKRFDDKGAPGSLTLVFGTAKWTACARGVDYLADEKMLKRVIGADFSILPAITGLIEKDLVEAYCLPQGVISHLWRDIAAKKPRTISHVGLGTFVDPDDQGGRLNGRTSEDIVEAVSFDGKKYLAYKTFPVNVALLCGSTADSTGNFALEKGGIALETLAIATAVHNSGGKVIVQVGRLAEEGMFSPWQIVVPGLMVDAVVVSSPELGVGGSRESFVRLRSGGLCDKRDSALRVASRRAMLELSQGDVVFFGPGAPECVSREAADEGLLETVRQTDQMGTIGVSPLGELAFNSVVNVEMVLDKPSHFDFISGGGVDVAFMEMSRVDMNGNVALGNFGEAVCDACLSSDIAQCAKKVVFLGKFTAGELETACNEAGQSRVSDGVKPNFVRKVEHCSFSGRNAFERGQQVLFVTERCVFELGRDGLMLREVAPGVDIGRDILQKMLFTPIVDEAPKRMDPSCFGISTAGNLY
jgi:propionate CoA-transferase